MTTDESFQATAAFVFDWGMEGLQALAPVASVIVIVDVLRFTSAVSAAVEAGCTVVPAHWPNGDEPTEAASTGTGRGGLGDGGGASLSPTDLLVLDAGTRVVLPSPNGATLAMAAPGLGAGHVLAGSLRNATATARRARQLAGSGPIALIASGERWPNGTLRPCVEDLLGAGAVLAALDPSGAASPPCCSPEAAAARAAFVAARPLLGEALLGTASGRELAARGWADDVHTSAALDVTDLAAQLVAGAFVAT